MVRKKFSRTQLLRFTANVQVHLIGMEACGGSHFLGRALREQGHDVRLMPAQYVKPYVKTNKNDYIDAEAIAEAVSPADDALCADQDRRPAGSAVAAPGTRAFGSVCCFACRSQPTIFFSASFVPSLCVGYRKVYSGRREADVVMSSVMADYLTRRFA